MNDIRNQLLRAGVKNLKTFGYPMVNEFNILTDPVYSAFFESALNENKGHSASVDQTIDGLLAEIKAARK
jgi:hypothetical protein